MLRKDLYNAGWEESPRARPVMNGQISQYIVSFSAIISLHPICYRVFSSMKIREKRDASELHDLKRNRRRGHYAVTKTLENDDNIPVLNVSHSFTARKPRRRVGLPQF